MANLNIDYKVTPVSRLKGYFYNIKVKVITILCSSDEVDDCQNYSYFIKNKCTILFIHLVLFDSQVSLLQYLIIIHFSAFRFYR